MVVGKWFPPRGVSLLGLLAQIFEAKELEKSKAPPKNNSGNGGLLNCLMILFEHLQLTTHHPIGICKKQRDYNWNSRIVDWVVTFSPAHIGAAPKKILHSATMLCITSAFSGDVIAELCALQLHGSSAVEVKQAVAAECGVPRFRQRLFLEDGSELEGDNLKLEAQTLELVILNFGLPDEEEDQELIEACRNEYETEVERLLMLPRNPNVRDQSWFLPNGPTPLHLASQMGNLRLVRLLLEAGADPDAVAHGATALFVAAANDKLDVARLLIHAGADPDLPGTDTFHLGVVLSCGLFFDFPLYGILPEKIGGEKSLELFKKVVFSTRQISGASEDTGVTPLFIAAGNGHVRIVRLLLDVTANANQATFTDGTTPNYASTPLSLATYKDNVEIIKLLLEARANVNDSGSQCGLSPLTIAVQNFRAEAEDQEVRDEVARLLFESLGES